jgi:hypothetical protein
MTAKTRPSRLRNVLINGALLMGSTLFALLLLELSLRVLLFGGLVWEHAGLPPIVREPDPETGWCLAPNQTAQQSNLDYQLVVRTNSEGLRDVEHVAGPDPDVFTIVVLGDSYMEASHVDLPQAFHRQLAEALGPGFRVVNLGVGGFGTVQAWRQFATRCTAYAPDLVLLGFYAENDVYNNSAELSRAMWGESNPRYFSVPYVTRDATGALAVVPPDYDLARAGFEAQIAQYSPRAYWLKNATDSALEKVYKQLLNSWRQRVHTPGNDPNIHLGVYLDQFDPALFPDSDLDHDTYARSFAEAWRDTGDVLAALRDDADAAGARLAVFTVPSKLQVNAAYQEAVAKAYPGLALDLERPHGELAAICARLEIPLRDLLPDFRAVKATGETLNYKRGDSHWNPAGHRLAAQRTAAWLRESGLVPE